MQLRYLLYYLKNLNSITFYLKLHEVGIQQIINYFFLGYG